MFVEGDLANATALAVKGNDPGGALCWNALAVALSATPNPSADGFAVLAERKRLGQQVVGGPCGSVIAPMILQDIGKAAGPFGLALPF